MKIICIRATIFKNYIIIGGTTLHTGLDFKFGTEYQKLSEKSNLRVLLKELELVIIDEISMIDADMLYKIHDRLCEIFYPSEDPFAGKSILLVGDIMQLRPIKGRFIFQEPKSERYVPLYETDPLWELFEVVVLETNHRQGEGNIWTEDLKFMRVGKLTEEIIARLEERRLENFPNLDTTNACHIYYTNMESEKQNTKNLRSLKTKLVTNSAIISKTRGYTPYTTEWGTIANTNLKKVLEIKIGARVMLIFNICTRDSLVNGELGTVSDICMDKKNNMVAIIVEFDNPDVGLEQRRNCQAFLEANNIKSGVPIFKDTFEYQIPSANKSKSHAKKIHITQFALRLAWASTCHKVQGISIKSNCKLIVHGHKNLPRGMAYVMLSRCSDRNSVYLDDKFDLEKIKCNPDALIENERLIQRSIVHSYKEERFDLYMINVNRLLTNLEFLEGDTFASRSNVIAVVETWMSPENESAISSTLGNFYGASADNIRGCGAFMAKPPFQSSHVVEKDFQILCLQIDSNVHGCIVYISSGCNLENVTSEIDNYMKTSQMSFIIGDFNFPTDEKNCLTRYFSENGFVQMVKYPTHDKGGKIDHLYVPSHLSKETCVQLTYPFFTDHAAICVKFCKN